MSFLLQLKTAESQFSIIDGVVSTNTGGSMNGSNNMLLVENLNTAGTGCLVNNISAAATSPSLYRNNSGGSRGTTTNHAGTNGSIITMTLKNNHLIVETEERNVSEIDEN